MKSINENVMKFVFLAAACTSVLAVALICIFLFANGIPAMAKIGLPDFLFGMNGSHPMDCMEFFHSFWEVFM